MPAPVTPATAGPNLPPIANEAIVDGRGFLTPLGLNLFQLMWAGIYGTNSIIDRLAQPGWIQPIGGATVTSGWLLCDNAAYSQVTYANLYAAIGSAWGAAPAGMFRVPGLKGNFAYGADGTHALGTMGGALSRVIAQANLPNVAFPVTDPGHVHAVTDPGHDHPITDPGHHHPGGFSATLANTAGVAAGTGTAANTGDAFTGITVDSNVTGVTVDSDTTGITVNSGGAGTALDTTPKFAAVNWMIKT